MDDLDEIREQVEEAAEPLVRIILFQVAVETVEEIVQDEARAS